MNQITRKSHFRIEQSYENVLTVSECSHRLYHGISDRFPARLHDRRHFPNHRIRLSHGECHPFSLRSSS